MEKIPQVLIDKLGEITTLLQQKVDAQKLSPGMCKADMESAIVGLVNKVSTLEDEIKKLKEK